MLRGHGGRKLINAAAAVGAALILSGAVPAMATNRQLRPPAVRSGAALEVQGTSVVLRGSIDPRGQATRYYFELGPTTSYGIAPELSERVLVGDRSEEVLEAIPELRHRTIYHFRLVAHSRGGTTHGKDKTFRTLGPAAP